MDYVKAMAKKIVFLSVHGIPASSRLYTREPIDPSKPCLIIVHGLLSDPSLFLDSIGDHPNFNVLYYHFNTLNSIEYMSSELDGVLSRLQTLCPGMKMVLMGHSLGTLVILHHQLMLSHSLKAAQVVLIAPCLYGSPWIPSDYLLGRDSKILSSIRCALESNETLKGLMLYAQCDSIIINQSPIVQNSNIQIVTVPDVGHLSILDHLETHQMIADFLNE